MIVFRTRKEIETYALHMRAEGKTIGFVPTMGALHQGHMELVRRAVAENEAAVCSIFVNPIQFNNPEDLKHYPRTLEKDLQMLEDAGCQVVFYPPVEEMYPEPETKVYDFGPLDKVMEGRYRPGHFNGVAIVVKKLFDLVHPHRAYFGEKDYQQLAIIQALVRMERLEVEIVPCPIVREEDGLAMSSRNMRLSVEQRKQATYIYQTLLEARSRYSSTDLAGLKAWVETRINSMPEMQLEYFEIADPQSLQTIVEPKPSGDVIACIVVQLGAVRLIDNMVFNA